MIAGTIAVTGGREWPAALIELYRAERLQLVRTAYLICGSNAVAEDVVHDALVRVARRFTGLEHGRAYLYTAVVNAARDVVRRRRPVAIVRDGEDNTALSAESIALRDALAVLPERQRIAVVLRYFMDWSDDEIAGQIGARPATVRSLLHRGVARLRQELEQ